MTTTGKDERARDEPRAGDDGAALGRKLEAAEVALEERTLFLDATLESVSLGIVACDAAGILTLFNRAAREFHGLPESPLPPEQWARHYHLFRGDGVTPLALDEVPLYRALRGEIVRDAEMVIAPAGLPRRLCLASGRALRDAHGRKLGAVVAMQDITALRRASDAVRESETFLDSIVENIPNMIFVKDAAELRFVRFNRAGEELIGVPRAQLIGKNDYDFFPREQADAFTQKDYAVLTGRTVVDIAEEPLTTPAGGARVLHTKKIPILGPDGAPRYLLGISEDITERREADAQRLRLQVEHAARTEAEALNRELQEERDLRERFVATLTHDLRSPLAAMRTSAELIRRYPDKADARERLTNRIIGSIERADKMIQKLLDAHLIRAGRHLPLDVTSCEVRGIVVDALEELSVVHANRFVLTPGEDVHGWWDASALRRVVENLATNAAKYGAPEGAITCNVERADADTVRLEVHNLGAPIPVDEQVRIFQAFHRTRSAVDPSGEGWGLGLALVRGIAEAHGGRVDVESAEDTGTRFRVQLPLDARPFLSAELSSA